MRRGWEFFHLYIFDLESSIHFQSEKKITKIFEHHINSRKDRSPTLQIYVTYLAPQRLLGEA